MRIPRTLGSCGVDFAQSASGLLSIAYGHHTFRDTVSMQSMLRQPKPHTFFYFKLTEDSAPAMAGEALRIGTCCAFWSSRHTFDLLQQQGWNVLAQMGPEKVHIYNCILPREMASQQGAFSVKIHGFCLPDQLLGTSVAPVFCSSLCAHLVRDSSADHDHIAPAYCKPS